jgi:hypothetical protein
MKISPRYRAPDASGASRGLILQKQHINTTISVVFFIFQNPMKRKFLCQTNVF